MAQVVSDSMTPTILRGDIVVIKECEQYYLNDIITYQEGSAYVTHRIVEVRDDSFITKGDNNNVNDSEPVKPESIYGKVILIIPALRRLFTNEKVYISVLVLFVLAVFFNDFVNIFRRKKISLKLLLLKSVCVIAFLCVMSFSKYTSNNAGKDTVRVATFFIDGQEQTDNINFSDMVPGSEQSYNIVITNIKDSKVAETAQAYSLRIIMTDANLPLEYTLERVSDTDTDNMLNISESISANSSTVVSGGKMPAGVETKHEYKLTISWPAEENDPEQYSAQSGTLQLMVESVQMDEFK